MDDGRLLVLLAAGGLAAAAAARGSRGLVRKSRTTMKQQVLSETIVAFVAKHYSSFRVAGSSTDLPLIFGRLCQPGQYEEFVRIAHRLCSALSLKFPEVSCAGVSPPHESVEELVRLSSGSQGMVRTGQPSRETQVLAFVAQRYPGVERGLLPIKQGHGTDGRAPDPLFFRVEGDYRNTSYARQICTDLRAAFPFVTCSVNPADDCVEVVVRVHDGGSRGVVRTSRAPALPVGTLADRLDRLDLERICLLDENGEVVPILETSVLRRWAEPILAGGDGGIVFTEMHRPAPRPGWVLFRVAGSPRDGFEIHTLDVDSYDSERGDHGLADIAAYLWHKSTKIHIPGGEFVAPDHSLIHRLFGLQSWA